MRRELRLVARPDMKPVRRQEVANKAAFPCSQYLSFVTENVVPHVALEYSVALKGSAGQVRSGDGEHIALDLGWFHNAVGPSTAGAPWAFWPITKLAFLCHADDPDHRAKLV